MTRELVDSIFETTPEAAARRIDESPRACGLVELRADALRAGDVAGLVRRAGRPVVATVRDLAAGGRFDGSTDEKTGILRAALDAGAAFVDVEWDGPLRELAMGPHASRTILSHHGAPCEAPALTALFDAMAGTRAERLKIVPKASRASDAHAVRNLLARAKGARRELCAFASGPAGAWSRVFAIAWGSWGTYGAAARGRETGDGQWTTRQMLDVYRVLAISESTLVFGLCGAPLSESPSPAMHAAGYRELGLDAVYVPIESGDVEDVVAIVEEGAISLSGLGVTIPLKEPLSRRCSVLDTHAACGSANTVTLAGGTWRGFNTDAPAALALIKKHLNPSGKGAAVIGAGATARAIGAALSGAGAIVTLYGRNAARAAEAARAIGADSAPLTDLPGAAWEVLVQATPAGRHGEELVLRRHLNGRMVLDAAYGAEATPLVRAARARGLAVADGFDLLLAQAVLQFALLTGREAPREAMRAALQPLRDASSA